MASATHFGHDAVALLKALLSTIETQIVPLTAEGVRSGSKVFGAAILSKSALEPLTVATNNERASPLLHGEINCIQTFFASPTVGGAAAVGGGQGGAPRPRPSTRDCVFVATHEPCSLCLSGIAWAGFDNFYHLFTHEDSRDRFAIPYDIQILDAVFRVPADGGAGGGGGGEGGGARPLYNRTNAFFTARSFAELVAEVEDEGERARWAAEVERVKKLYGSLSDAYQEGKQKGVETSSAFK
jgi:tRNA(Arg) A34 adenosine deaminase TadA